MLLLGTVCERKGQADLLRAFAKLRSEVAARIKCVVVGARESLAYSRRLERMANKLKPDRRERFLIVPETRETAIYWRAADIFCCTSRIESYPRVILEAMAAGLPIVTTPVFGIAEQVRESVNALLYEPGNIRALRRQLELLVRDPQQRAAFAAASGWVLAGLPNYRDMDRQYLETFCAAAEGAPLLDPATEETIGGDVVRRKGTRIWTVGTPRTAVTAPRSGRSFATAEVTASTQRNVRVN